MKIYFIGQKGLPAKFGGIERHVEELSIKLTELGHEVFVYTRPNYTPAKLKKYKGVNLISIPTINTKHLDTISHTFLACLDLLRRDVDIIHFHSIGPSSLIWLARILKPRIPVISTFHTKCYLHKKWGNAAKMYLKFGEKMCCTFADKTIAVSNSLARYAKKNYGKTVKYIPNGVACALNEKADIIKKKWNLEKNGYILAVSRLIGHKGIHYLIEAYSGLKTDKKLVIAGDGVFSDDYVEKIKAMAKENSNIILTGNQTGKTLRELYSNGYFFVQPSESEGLSVALLEAMAYENLVLVSNIAENKEAAGDCGITFQSKDVCDLQKKLTYLLKNPEFVKERGILSARRAVKFYNWDAIANETIKVYEESIEERKFAIIHCALQRKAEIRG